MFSPSNGKLTGPILGLSLAAVATGLYLSPVGNHLPKPNANGGTTRVTQTVTASPSADPSSSSGRAGSPAGTRSTGRSGSGSGSASGSGSGAGSSSQPRAPRPEVTVGQPGYRVDGGIPNLPSDDGPVDDGPGQGGGSSPAPAPPQKPVPNASCASYKWQQDAQKAYLADLNDPNGLDGKPGPRNDDGIACAQLPVDPSRAKSYPAASFKAPADKSTLVNSKVKYFGVSQDTLPGDVKTYDAITGQAGKAPSLIEFFDTWDQPFDKDATKVQTSWKRGALPVLTWMPEAKGGTTKDQSSYALQNIVNGQWDSYLDTYANAIVNNGLPLGIRFAHEMNGNWYPWSAGYNHPEQGIVNTPALYRAAWQHIWNVFDKAGANKLVIWIYTPIRVDGIDAGHHGYTTVQEDYPGDQYVDWVGMSAYEYKFGYTTGYDYTFGATISQLKALTSKPIFLAETGATAERPVLHRSTDKVTIDDSNPQKAKWFGDVLGNLLADPQVIGFAYFDNRVVNVHSLTFTHKDGVTKEKIYFTTGWRIETSAETQTAFRNAVSNNKWDAGIDPYVN